MKMVYILEDCNQSYISCPDPAMKDVIMKASCFFTSQNFLDQFVFTKDFYKLFWQNCGNAVYKFKLTFCIIINFCLNCQKVKASFFWILNAKFKQLGLGSK